jgi:hypothetical protein
MMGGHMMGDGRSMAEPMHRMADGRTMAGMSHSRP